MDKLMDNPWFLRFTALFLAIILFISTQAEESEINGKPPGDQSDIIHNIPVKVYYDNENLVVTGIPETVNMTIVGPTNIVQTTKLLQDFTLFVDLNELPMGKHSVEIKSENISEKLDVRFDPAAIDIVIEEKITKIFRVDPDLNDRMLAEDFHIVNMEVLPSEIEITGAKSVIESISFVKATASKDEGINKSFEQKTRVRVLDKDLNKLNVVISPEEVTVKVDVAEYNKEVPIVLKKRGTPAEGIAIDSLTATETMITLSGPRKVLDAIGEFVVDVDVAGVKGQETLDIELKKPKGVSAISVEKMKVKIEATVTETETEVDKDPDVSDLPEEPAKTTGTKTFDNIQIAVRGLDNKFKSTFLLPVDGLLTLTVKAESKVIEALKRTDFIVYVDIDETAEEGEQVLSVSVDGPEDISWQLSENEVTMKIELA